jgi:hypothetical protein
LISTVLLNSQQKLQIYAERSVVECDFMNSFSFYS